MQAKTHNEDGYAMLIVLLVSALIILFVMTKMYLNPRNQTTIDPATLELKAATTTTIEAMHGDVDAAREAGRVMDEHNREINSILEE